MSIFAKLILSKKAAKQHKEKQKEKEKDEVPATVPYRHVPTHAAVDALNGAPPSWSHSDRPKIKAEHRRRSEMAVRRTESSLSTITMSYANSTSNRPVTALPRNTSFNGHNPAWFDADRSNPAYYRHEPAAKRHKTSRAASFHDSGIGPSPLGSNVQSEGDASPSMSSGESTTSNSNSEENSEMAQAKHRAGRPQSIVYGEQDIFDRLHTSTTRKLGEAPIASGPSNIQKAPVVTATPIPQPKAKKRWSLMGKKNAISAM